MNYYNEHDPKAAAWLRALIAAGEIPAGVVDERSIIEIKATELTEYVQCHFFAGIGGWSLALKLAGWPASRKVWTGSCPCQPFSSAGRGMGEADERHLWPVFRNLIGECRPPVVFGEQVASKAGLQWLDGVCADMEAAGYAIGAADMCAASVGAPHIRQRLYWVADSDVSKRDEWTRSWQQPLCDENENAGRVVLPNGAGRNTGKQTAASVGHGNPAIATSGTDGMEYAESDGRKQRRAESSGRRTVSGRSNGGLANPARERRNGSAGMSGTDRRAIAETSVRMGNSDEQGCAGSALGLVGSAGAWGQCETILCADGKARRIESGSFPLAHGIPGRVGLLRGYGNAIVPQVASEFIGAWLDTSNI